MAQRQLSDWRAESIRYTYFYNGEVPDHLRTGLWRSIVGADPETSTSRPLEGVVQDEGAFMGVRLVVSVGVNRIDVLFVAQPNAAALEPTSLGAVSECANEIRSAVEKHAELWKSNAIRYAYGMVALLPAAKREDAYIALSELLSTVKVDLKSRDLFYQINHPRPSSLNQAIEINRLSKWHALLMKRITLESGTATSMHDVYMTRVELDFNTAPQTPVNSDPRFMDELIEDAHKTLEQGES